MIIKETGTIFDVNTARDCSIKSFDDYIMSPDEKLILIQTETKPIYRRSLNLPSLVTCDSLLQNNNFTR